jgi:hypothetical protein
MIGIQHLLLVERLVDVLAESEKNETNLIQRNEISHQPLRTYSWYNYIVLGQTKQDSELYKKTRDEILKIYKKVFEKLKTDGDKSNWEIKEKGDFACEIVRNSTRKTIVSVYKSSEEYEFIAVKGPEMQTLPIEKYFSIQIKDFRGPGCTEEQRENYLLCFLAYNFKDLHEKYSSFIGYTCKDNLKEFKPN